MQTPLFWVDLSAYGVELQVIEAAGRLSSLMVDMGQEPVVGLAESLRDVGFKAHNAARPNLVSHTQPTDDTISRIELALADSRSTAFDVNRHMLIANVLDPDAPPRSPVRNAVQQQRDAIQGAAEAAPTATPEQAKPATDESLIVDVGEVRGFPIKELRGNGDKLRAAAARMTRDQQEKYLRKSTLWPSPNYNEMAENGVEPAAAALVKRVRDSFLPAPGVVSSRRKYREPPNAEVYAHAIITARDIMAPVKTLDEAAAAVYDLGEAFSVTREETTTTYNGASRRQVWTSHLSPLTQTSDGEDMPKSARSLTGVVNARHSFWLAAIDPDDPEVKERIIRRNRLTGLPGTFDNTKWHFLPRNHALRTGRSRSLTNEEKANRAEREKAKPPTRIPRSQHADAVRSGLTEWRTGDVSAEDLVARFDLSGVEFGNWEGQRDRQELLNQAYDAFNDLSQALGVSTHAIGLGGRLGMAFGSRGQGGKNPAAAHFEPENFAINLTKRGGAGALAHEWGHAFDRAGSQGGRIGRFSRMASSDLGGRHPWSERKAQHTTFGNTTAKNFDSLMSAILFDPDESKIRARRSCETAAWGAIALHTKPRANSLELGKKVQPAHLTVEELVNNLASYTIKGLVDELMVDDTMARSLVSRIIDDTPYGHDHVLADIQSELGPDSHDIVSALGHLHTGVDQIVRNGLKISCLRDEQSSFAWANLDDKTIQGVKSMQEDLVKETVRSIRAPSVMYEQAKRMDTPRSNPYWSRAEEMFARAFECYVKTRIAEQGGRNDFLVSYHKPENMNGDVYESVYPTGSHLALVKARADALFSELSVEERASASPMRQGKTGVVLYSIDGDRMTSGAPSNVQAHLALGEVRRIVGDIVGVRLEDEIGDTPGGELIGGLYHHDARLIRIALNGKDPVSTASHEAYHAAAECLMSDAERQIVSSAFSPGGRYHNALVGTLRKQGNTGAIEAVSTQPREASAYGFQSWLKGDLAIDPGNPVSRVFAKIQDVMERVRNAFEGHGYRCASDIFKALDDGTVAERSKDLMRRPVYDDEDMAPIMQVEPTPARSMGLS